MSLRFILAVIGVLILAVILWDGYRHWRKSKKYDKKSKEARGKHSPVKVTRIEPTKDFDQVEVLELDRELDLPLDEPIAFDKSADEFDDVLLKPKAAQATLATPAKPPQFIMLHLLAEEGVGFTADDLRAQFEAEYLDYGPMRIFHRYLDESSDSPVLFSVANAFEPGTLDLDDAQDFYTSGLTLFMQLPGQFNATETFELMLQTARSLADHLCAQLCDHQREFLTAEMTQHYRDQAACFD